MPAHDSKGFVPDVETNDRGNFGTTMNLESYATRSERNWRVRVSRTTIRRRAGFSEPVSLKSRHRIFSIHSSRLTSSGKDIR